MRKQALLSLIFVVLGLVYGLSAAAQATVRGIVVDLETNDAIPGATVALQGSNAIVITDDNGKFSITTRSAKANLQFSCIGYENLILPINKTGEVDLGDAPLDGYHRAQRRCGNHSRHRAQDPRGAHHAQG